MVGVALVAMTEGAMAEDHQLPVESSGECPSMGTKALCSSSGVLLLRIVPVRWASVP